MSAWTISTQGLLNVRELKMCFKRRSIPLILGDITSRRKGADYLVVTALESRAKWDSDARVCLDCLYQFGYLNSNGDHAAFLSLRPVLLLAILPSSSPL